MKLSIFRMGLGALLVMALSFPAFAADKAVEAEQSEILMRGISIIGSKAKVKDIAGSAAYLDVQDIREHGVEDVNRILRRVPGVNLREEDGYGLFPNISLRGVDPARSNKVTIMEDGILMAPAPYSAPSAYYSPNTGRMSGIEVVKGSSQVKFGPHTTGGAINFLSTPIPTSQKVYSKSTFGYWNELRTHTYFGNTEQLSGGGKMGYLIEYYMRDTTGFKELDTNTPDVRGEPNTGFTRQEPMIKLFYEPKTSLYQRLEAKFGFSNLDANETYLGLSSGDFANNPYRRYAASRFDEIESTQFRTYVRHLIEFNKDTSLVTTVYGNTFNRNWQKLDKVDTNSTGGSGANTHEAMTQGPGGDDYQCLTGVGAGSDCFFKLKNNNRSYYMHGVQFDLRHKLVTGDVRHDININLRQHYDQIRRKQWVEVYDQEVGGGVVGVHTTARGSESDRTQKTHATAVNISDKMKSGKFTFTPGVRTEYIRAKYCDGNCGEGGVTEGARDYNVVVGGGNIKYDVLDADGRDLDVFGGAYRGFSPPDPRGGLKNNIREETSVGWEIGTRYANARKAFNLEATFFRTEIDNLIVPDNVGGAGTEGDTLNAGEVRTQGVELLVNYDRGLHKKWAVQTPMYVSVTYTDAEFQTDVGSTDEESIFTGAKKGNDIPYIPDLQLAFGIGAIYKKWSANIDGSFITASYADGSNTSSTGDRSGDLNERYGKIDSRLVLDGTIGYRFNDKARMFTNFKNITNQHYVVSRQPNGPRPGMPFAMMAGLEFSL